MQAGEYGRGQLPELNGRVPIPELAGRGNQDYLETKRRWAGAFELPANADGRTTTVLYLEAARHAELYPSAREAMQITATRMCELDPGFMERMDGKLLAGAPPILALESTAREQSQLPRGATLGPELAAAQLELERLQQVRQPGIPVSDTELSNGRDRVDAVAIDLRDHNEQRAALQAPGQELSTAASPQVDSANRAGQVEALRGLSADGEQSGQQVKAAVDLPATSQDERVQGLADSGERFQVAESANAQASILSALSYPKPVEATMDAVQQQGPTIRPVSKPLQQAPRQGTRRYQIVLVKRRPPVRQEYLGRTDW